MIAPIHRSDLEAQLSDPHTAESALVDYLVLVETGPFRHEYRLRPNAPIKDAAPEERLGDSLGSTTAELANQVARSARRRAYLRRKEMEPDLVRIVAEGDSWFQHPLLKDIVDHLGANANILSLAGAGDALGRRAGQGEYVTALREEHARILLWSGGGAELLGDLGACLTNPVPRSGSHPSRFLNEVFDANLAAVHGHFDEIANRLAEELPDAALVTHAYDDAIPMAPAEGGRWLGPPMLAAGIDLEADGRRVIRHLFDALDAGLQERAATRKNVVRVASQGTVADGEWDDEIHPTSQGFKKLALRFELKIDLLEG